MPTASSLHAGNAEYQHRPASDDADGLLNLDAVYSQPTGIKHLNGYECLDMINRFFVELGFDEKRSRFGGAVSAASIMAYCRSLIISEAILIGYFIEGRLIALVEVHPLKTSFLRAEIAVCCPRRDGRAEAIAHLIQVAAFAAAERGCRIFVYDEVAADPLVSLMLREIGSSHRSGDLIYSDIGGYSTSCLWSGSKP